MSKKSYSWGLNERYYIDSEGNIEESDGESPPQTGTVPKFVATELIRLARIDTRDSKDICCSFCDLPRDKVRMIIRGHGQVYICDQCVDLCVVVLSELLGGEKLPNESVQV